MDTRKTSSARPDRRHFLASTAAMGALALTGRGAWAQAYPDRPLQFVVPFAAGGGTDLVARPVALGMGKALGQSVVVVNKAGAAGNIGTQQVARASPDGYTVGLGSTGTHTVNQSLYTDLGYDPIKDFAPVSMICYYTNVLVVHPSFPAKSLLEFIALIKANPGKYMYGITQNGSSAHLAMELLKYTAGLELPGVPYRGASAAMTDFLGGQFPILMDVVVNQQQYIRDGRSRALATTASKRAPSLAEIPTVAESGFPGFEGVGWNGVFVPARTPVEIVAKLNAAVRSALAEPAMAELAKNGLMIKASTPDALGSYVRAESAKWAKLIQGAGIKAS